MHGIPRFLQSNGICAVCARFVCKPDCIQYEPSEEEKERASRPLKSGWHRFLVSLGIR